MDRRVTTIANDTQSTRVWAPGEASALADTLVTVTVGSTSIILLVAVTAFCIRHLWRKKKGLSTEYELVGRRRRHN
jgi:hypothetical protein